MPEPSKEKPVTETTPSSVPAPADGTPDVEAIIAARVQADSLVKSIQEQADVAAARNNDIEQGRFLAEKARGEIDGQVTTMKEAVAGLQQQLDSAKSLFAEVTKLHGSVQEASNETVEVKALAAATLQSVQALLTNATEKAESAGVKNKDIEQARLLAEMARSEIDGHVGSGFPCHPDAGPHEGSLRSSLPEPFSLHRRPPGLGPGRAATCGLRGLLLVFMAAAGRVDGATC
jgi:hypothetical protein